MVNIVGCLFISGETKKFLLLRRSKSPNDKFGGYWSLLTGHMDKGELPYQSMDRESFEEIGVKRYSLNFHKEKTYESGDKVFHMYYVIVPKEFEPKLNEENIDYMWTDLGTLPTPLYPGTKEKIKSILTLI